MLAIALTSGAEPRAAAWAVDAMSLYVAGYALETSLVRQRRTSPDSTWTLSSEEVVRRLPALPAGRFPQTSRYVAELTSGTGHGRFDFALEMFPDAWPQTRPRDDWSMTNMFATIVL